MIFIGIDPGLNGAMAVLNPDLPHNYVQDTPYVEVMGKTKTKKGNLKIKREYFVSEMAKMLEPYSKIHFENVIVVIENVHSMPGEGVSAAFSFGKGLGLWEGIIAAYRLRYEKITPQRWKKAMLDGMGKEKDASRLQAQRLFPDLAEHLKLKKHHGRGDAILMAEFMRRTYRSN
jgi:hypothetical protein